MITLDRDLRDTLLTIIGTSHTASIVFQFLHPHLTRVIATNSRKDVVSLCTSEKRLSLSDYQVGMIKHNS